MGIDELGEVRVPRLVRVATFSAPPPLPDAPAYSEEPPSRDESFSGGRVPVNRDFVRGACDRDAVGRDEEGGEVEESQVEEDVDSRDDEEGAKEGGEDGERAGGGGEDGEDEGDGEEDGEDDESREEGGESEGGG